jgi:two-component system sensor histidine kinase VicK
MTNLVNALLNVSRLEMGTFLMNVKLANIKAEVEKCINEHSKDISKRKLKIVSKFKNKVPSIKIDVDLFHIVLENILSNSIKYSFEGSELKLNVRDDGEDLIISLSDSGIGIPKEDQDKIFTKMFRSDNAKLLDPDGSGLGLYICKEIVDYSGGKIWLESTIGKGSTFFISWPLTGMKKQNIIN